MIDQVLIIPPLPGVGENLETTFWHADGSGRRFSCDVRCRVCGLAAGARVMSHGEMHNLDYRFWLNHFQTAHAELLVGTETSKMEG